MTVLIALVIKMRSHRIAYMCESSEIQYFWGTVPPTSESETNKWIRTFLKPFGAVRGQTAISGYFVSNVECLWTKLTK